MSHGIRLALPGATALGLPADVLAELARIDRDLAAIWNLGDNVLLAWTHGERAMLVLAVRHYAIAESVHANAGLSGVGRDAPRFIREVLAGPKYMQPTEFNRVCTAFGRQPDTVPTGLALASDELAGLVSEIVRRYGVSLVRNHAVVLLDAVRFSLQSPLDQMSMLNSLAYSVNSAYAQLLSKDIPIDFARTNTGDGFYIWNRSTAPGANAELYMLLMMLLADNAVARGKARSSWVPQLRAAFHVGEHYEFHQVEGLNPTHFSYIVGRVTVDLARMLDHALPGQILVGDFAGERGAQPDEHRLGASADFVESTSATLDQLNGLKISGGLVEGIRCYLTGQTLGPEGYCIDRFRVRDKHGMPRTVFNAKINIKRDREGPIYLGIRTQDLAEFAAWRVAPLQMGAAA